MSMQYVSPLLIHDGFAYGWATRKGQARVEVHLWMDGRHVATEYTGAELPAFCQAHCGKPSAPQAGFAFALPAQALDGFAHDLHVGIPGNPDGSLHGEVQSYEHSPVRGEVRQQGRQFIGTVWFKTRPARPAHLEVTSAQGHVHLRHPLSVSATSEKHGYPAQFAVPCDSLPADALNFSCRGQALRGSPCSRRITVLGLLEAADANGIRGWAFDSADLSRPLELCLRVDGRPMAWFRPNTRRPEIETLARPHGTVGLIGFHLPLPEGLADGRTHRIEVVAADDGHVLNQGHKILKIDTAWVEHAPAPCSSAIARQSSREAQRAPNYRDPVVSLVILNRNGQSVLSAFMDSWARHNTSLPAEVIVIDHASTDGSLEMLAGWAGRMDLKVLALDHNGSFSESSNLGARHARGEYLLFMNNDIVWLHDALPRMLESLQQPDVGIVGLKLLKAVGESQHALQPATEVQHLGVRFKLNDRGYWPYEVAPSALRQEAEHAPQDVPAVTGAALLCRKSDFEQAGGFDAEYFYGFEDVELCMRLSQRLRKRVVCRNDICALHRHGHTRLSGREMSLFDRVQRNSAVLESQLGLWLKQAYWRSLLQCDGYMTSEALTIGLVVDRLPGGKDDSPLNRDALALATQLKEVFPHARVVFLPPDRGWKNAADLHVLVVGTPDYDVRAIQNARADLLTVAWLRSEPARWSALPWWLEFGGYLAGHDLHTDCHAGLDPASMTSWIADLAQPTSSAPLGNLLDVTRWRMRVAVHVPLAQADLGSNDPLARQARSLLMALKGAGLPCWQVPLEQWGSNAAMADACITLHGERSAQAWKPRPDLLHVLWLSGAGAQPPRDWQPRHGRLTRSQPTAQWLEQAMEESIGSTFHPS